MLVLVEMTFDNVIYDNLIHYHLMYVRKWVMWFLNKKLVEPLQKG